VDAARHARGKELFAEALQLPVDERSAFVRRACNGDPSLLQDLEQLLQHHEQAGDFLDRPVLPAPPPRELTLDGLVLRGYRIERELGRGGMGVVYLAWQESPRRAVALKFLRVDTLDREPHSRFRLEAEILGRLSHPGIAHILEAGLAESVHGPLPWIALEYVRGVPLRDWVARHAPGLREVVRLFTHLCEAVDHAHQKGIVHRDLKPSNVMVDERGQVRVLDFGVARLLEDETGAPRNGDGNAPPLEPMAPTRTGQLVGTLAYASPEQVSRQRVRIDARSDVHALGLMLFELLTGQLPYPIDEEHVLATIQTITVAEPQRLRRLRPDAPADLETILRKALEKDPRRRYADAGELRADLERFLVDRPVVARPPTALYQAEKLVRRHPALMVSTVVVLLALVVSVVVLSVSRSQVRAQLAETSGTLDFVAREFFRLTPTLGYGQERRGSLEELESQMKKQLALDPDNRPLRWCRARALFELAALDLEFAAPGSPERAIERAEQARVLLTRLLEEQPDDLEAATQLSQVFAKLGEAHRALGDTTTMGSWFQRALENDERLVATHPGDLELVEDLGHSLARLVEVASARGDADEAFRLAQRRVTEGQALVAADPDNWKFVYNLSQAYLFTSYGHRERGSLEASRADADECLRLAHQVCGMQPSRRDFVRWLVCAYENAVMAASSLGDLEGASRYALLAFTTAMRLAYGEPQQADYLTYVAGDGRSAVTLARELGDEDTARYVVERMRGVLELARSADAPTQALTTLETVAAELEAGSTPAADR